MKKISIVLATVLAFVLSLVCLSGCFLYQGKYTASAIVIGNTTTELEDSESFVELKGDDVAVVSINILSVVTLEGEGTWKKSEEEDSYVLTVGGINYDFTIEGGKMTIDFAIAKLILER